MTPKNWKRNTYSNDTWTDVVVGEAILASVLIVNTSVDPVVARLRLSGGAEIVPFNTLEPGSSHTLDLRSLVIETGESLQMQANVAGITVIASGVV